LSFNALSYVWGDPIVTEAILVNGNRIQVTTNLVSALRYAPYHPSRSKNTTTMKPWVDAMCINQTDSTEKGHQVSMMTDIYSQSGIVLRWLGSPID
ncbi:Heterokaryon incompatibility protein 6, OR allele, partial [Fusarium odoratissimum]